MEAKIIEIATERKTEENLGAIATEYFHEVSNGKFPIYGTIDKGSGLLVIVADKPAQESLMAFVNELNQRSVKSGV